jgi:hypothetical protein
VAALASAPDLSSSLFFLSRLSHTVRGSAPLSLLTLTASDPQQHERRKTQGTGPMIGMAAIAVFMTIITTAYYYLVGMKYNSFCDP